MQKQIPVVIRFIEVLGLWYICHAKSYQNAFGSKVNGFNYRYEAVDYAVSQGCVVEHHEEDPLQVP